MFLCDIASLIFSVFLSTFLSFSHLYSSRQIASRVFWKWRWFYLLQDHWRRLWLAWSLSWVERISFVVDSKASVLEGTRVLFPTIIPENCGIPCHNHGEFETLQPFRRSFISKSSCSNFNPPISGGFVVLGSRNRFATSLEKYQQTGTDASSCSIEFKLSISEGTTDWLLSISKVPFQPTQFIAHPSEKVGVQYSESKSTERVRTVIGHCHCACFWTSTSDVWEI